MKMQYLHISFKKYMIWYSDNIYHNYLNERRGADLIVSLSEGALIRGGRLFKSWRSLKKCKVGTN